MLKISLRKKMLLRFLGCVLFCVGLLAIVFGVKNNLNVLADSAVVDGINYYSNDLAMAVGFSAGYDDADGHQTVDSRVGLYATTSGSVLNYLGETGITGRDPRILYKDGVFYMATTKGGSYKGGYTFNVFKSRDLLTWTDDYEYPYSYRYEVGTAINNKYGLASNTWGPKWVVIDDRVYMIVYTSKFDSDGSRLYYINARKLETQDVEYDSSINIDTYTEAYENAHGVVKGILIKEMPILNDSGRAEYVNDENEVLYTRDDSGNIYNSSGIRLVADENDSGIFTDENNHCVIDIKRERNLQCNGGSWKKISLKTKKIAYKKGSSYIQTDFSKSFDTADTSNYPLFDAFISEVQFGNEYERMDLNNKNLTFTGFVKLNFDVTGAENYYQGHSIHPALIRKGLDNDYRYMMIAKTDPYGTIQRWLSQSITGPYYQVDDRFYPERYTIENGNYVSNTQIGANDIACTSLVHLSEHSERPSSALSVQDDGVVFSGHFEGTSMETFGGDMFVFSDHYNAASHVNADTSGMSLAEKRRKYFGEYYSKLANDDIGLTSDHLRYSSFVKVGVNNATLRPSDITNNVLRNIDVFRPADSDNLSSFKRALRNAARFNINKTIYDTTDESKVIAVVRTNRAIHENTNAEWYRDGWRYISDLINDEEIRILNPDLIKRFKTFGHDTPYNYDEVYLYKVLNKNQSEDVVLQLTDGNGNEESIVVLSKNSTPSSLNGTRVLFDGDSIAKGSYAFGGSSAPRWSYADYISETYDLEVMNAAVGGSRYYNPNGVDNCNSNPNEGSCTVIPLHLTDEVKNSSFDYIVLEGGTNDLHSGIYRSDPDLFEQTFRSYLDTVTEQWPYAKIGFVIVPHADYSRRTGHDPEIDATFWKMIEEICDEYSIDYINFFKISESDSFEVPEGFDWDFMNNDTSGTDAGITALTVGSYDGLHPTKGAHQVLGEYIAEWMIGLPRYKNVVIFDANGGTIDGESTKVIDVVHDNVVINPGTPINGGNEFLYWSDSTLCGQAYDFNNPITNDKTIYACWRSTPPIQSFTLSFNLVDGAGNIPNQTCTTTDSNCTVIIPNVVPTKDGYNFLGYASSSSATEATNQPGDSVTLSADKTLYAVWERKPESEPSPEPEPEPEPSDPGDNTPNNDNQSDGENDIVTPDTGKVTGSVNDGNSVITMMIPLIFTIVIIVVVVRKQKNNHRVFDR